MTDLTTCELCGELAANYYTRPTTYTYKGVSIELPQRGMHCSSCEDSVLSSSDLRENRADLMLFQGMVDMVVEMDNTVEIPNFSSVDEFIEWVREK